jgi:hypothetical protein
MKMSRRFPAGGKAQSSEQVVDGRRQRELARPGPFLARRKEASGRQRRHGRRRHLASPGACYSPRRRSRGTERQSLLRFVTLILYLRNVSATFGDGTESGMPCKLKRSCSSCTLFIGFLLSSSPPIQNSKNEKGVYPSRHNFRPLVISGVKRNRGE